MHWMALNVYKLYSEQVAVRLGRHDKMRGFSQFGPFEVLEGFIRQTKRRELAA